MANRHKAGHDLRGPGIWPVIESAWRDVLLAFRNWVRNPASTMLALLVLGATIGLNTTWFTVFNSIAMRPWAVHDPSRVVNLYHATVNATTGPEAAGEFSLAEFQYLAQHSPMLSGVIAMHDADDITLSGDDRPVQASYVSDNYFNVLGIEMVRGRGFAPVEGRIGAPQPVVVLGYHTWMNQFGGDSEVVGKNIRVGPAMLQVVGIAPEAFGGTNAKRTELWVPFATMPLLRPTDKFVHAFLTGPNECCVSIAARLGPGVDRERASAELNVLDRQFTTEYKQKDRKILITGTSFLANPGAKRALIIPAFGLIFVGVSVVLLLACANIGSLLLARAAARRREMAIRTALGASRLRLLRQFMTENLLLACAAGLLAFWIASALPSYLMNDVLGQELTFRLEPDLAVFIYTLAVTIAASMAFGLVPALQATRLQADEVLREHTATSSVRQRARNLLLGVQVMASVVLLICASLLARGLNHAQMRDPGFAVRGISVVSLDLPADAYEVPRLQNFFTTLERDLAESSVAGAVAFASHEPFSSRRNQIGCRASEQSDRALLALHVSPAYFDVLRIPLAAGRTFRRGEEPTSIILNEAAAQQYWPRQNPIGQTLVCGGVVREVVGIARDAHTWGLDQIEPTAYNVFKPQPPPVLLVRSAGSDPVGALAALIKGYDDRVKLHTAPLSALLDKWLAPTKAMTGLAAVLGTYALILAGVGMFGVFSYVVQQRASELGIRMALGATPVQVIFGVLASTTRAVALGALLGVACAGLASQLLARYLYGLSPLDPVAYGGAILTVAGTALAATYLPARRATRLDPAAIMRCP